MKKFAIAVAALALIATAGTAHAGMGGTMEFNGSFDPRIGIHFGGEGTTIDLLGGFSSMDGLGTVISVGGRFEKLMSGGGNASPLFGLCADVDLGSPDEGDSWTDIAFGGFLGGRVEIVEDFSIAGHMGVKVAMVGERFENDESSTNIGTFVNVALRLSNLWGGK
jgi:hypothetical protein